MHILRLGILLATAALVTSPLLYFGFKPTYLAQVLVQPDSEIQAQVFPKEGLTKPNDSGIAFFNFQAHINELSIQKVFLEIRPTPELEFYRQGEYRVDNGLVLGVAQLGSPKYPLRQNEQYMFRLINPEGHVLLNGRILANVYSIAGGKQWLIISIGLLASVIQILSVFLLPLLVRSRMPGNKPPNNSLQVSAG